MLASLFFGRSQNTRLKSSRNRGDCVYAVIKENNISLTHRHAVAARAQILVGRAGRVRREKTGANTHWQEFKSVTQKGNERST